MTGWLIFISCLLIIVVLFQVTRTLDLVSELKDDDRTTEGMSKFHGMLLVTFMILGVIGFFYCFVHYKDKLLPPSASEHGALIEKMLFWTIVICSIVCIITNVLLFVFPYIYRYRKSRMATHFAHSNKLEFIWTIIPTIVLTALVIFGLQAWTKITNPPAEDDMTIEMTAQQFFWTSRYPGEDGKLGPNDRDLICADNPVGIITREYVEHRMHTLSDTFPKPQTAWGEIPKLYLRMQQIPPMMDSLEAVMHTTANKWRKEADEDTWKSLKEELNGIPAHIKTRKLNLERLQEKYTEDYYTQHAAEMTWGYDDIMPDQLHLPVNKEVFVKIVALDVLHDFDIPYMRVKMDAVPGMPTSFKFKPITTTTDMREYLSSNPEWQRIKEGQKEPMYKNFDYEVACAELCGKGHNSMKYILVVDDQEDYDNWIAKQATKWSQVVDKLILDGGVSKYAPVMKVEMPTDSLEKAIMDTSIVQ